MEALLTQFAAVLARAMVDSLLEHLPQIVAAWREATTSTAVDAPTDPAADDAVAKQVQDAIDAGQAPPPDAVLHR